MILNLLVGVPAYRGEITAPHSDALDRLKAVCAMTEAAEMQRAAKSGPSDKYTLPSAQSVAFHWLGMVRADSCDLAHNRNMFVQAALDGFPIQRRDGSIDPRRIPVHWLLMVDADVYPLNPWPVLQMLHDAWARDAPMVAAPVMRRDGWLNVHGESPVPLRRADVAGKVLGVRQIGTAFMALNVPWLAAHWPWNDQDAWFQFVPKTTAGKPGTTSEDFTFCARLAAHGHAPLCDGRFEPGHVGAPANECPPTKPD